ncbi:MAG: hypothetical protein ACR2OK_05585 [Parvibaculales bacterium]
MTRAIKEPGGVLLIGVGLDDIALDAALREIYADASSLTVLVDGQQQKRSLKADDIWVYSQLGLRGALALIRRIAWRRFDAVYQPNPHHLPYLKFFIWPRPNWLNTV